MRAGNFVAEQLPTKTAILAVQGNSSPSHHYSFIGYAQVGGEFNSFLKTHEEKWEHNQYWYSPGTAAALIAEIEDAHKSGGRVALISTPSIYFGLPISIRKDCHLFDIDRQWETDKNFVYYDFNHPEELPEALSHTFSMVVMDPPFITAEVWSQYALAAKQLLQQVDDGTSKGRVLLSTIENNQDMIFDLFNAKPQAFLPSIPNLVYQYRLFANYDSPRLCQLNPEIPVEE